MSTTEPVRCAACLRAVIKTHELAALLRLDLRRFSEDVTAGRVMQAQPSHEPRGFIFDAADAEAMIREHYLPGSARLNAERHLLGLRTGALRVKNQRIEPSPKPEWATAAERTNPADALLDVELRDVVATAQATLGEAISSCAEFDAWAAEHAGGLTHRDVLIRLGEISWLGLVGNLAAAPNAPTAAPPAWNLLDPIDAICAYHDQRGTWPSMKKFDAWGPAAGCPLTHRNVERLTGKRFSEAIAEARRRSPGGDR